MQLRAFTIFDKKIGAHHAPFFAPTDGAAVRALSDLASDVNTTVGRHPADYCLYCIGVFDDAGATFESFTPKTFVVEAAALITPQPQGSLFEERS